VETDSSRKLPRAAARPQPDPQDSTCWLQIARYYDNPWGDSTLFKPDSVLYYLRLGAEARHPESQYVLGIYLARGTLGPRQPKAGINWLTQAADAGSARACQALMELLGPDPGRSFLPPAQQVPQDLPRSFEYALRGAALNNPECAFQVAHKYQKGEGTPQNDSMAIHWMDHAARHHQDIRAQLELGDWFFYGKTNLGRQHERALEYYDLARNHHYRSVDQYAHAEAKAHDIRRFPELIYNVRTLSLFLLPDNAFVVPFEH
jgi:TPR repeat protein